MAPDMGVCVGGVCPSKRVRTVLGYMAKVTATLDMGFFFYSSARLVGLAKYCLPRILPNMAILDQKPRIIPEASPDFCPLRTSKRRAIVLYPVGQDARTRKKHRRRCLGIGSS